MTPLISIKQLEVNFNTQKGTLRAVRGVDFNIFPGETLGLVGESGSGKSVTSMAIMNLLPGNTTLKSDSIFFKENDITKMSKEDLRKYRGGKVGIIFQEPGRSFDPIYPVGKTLIETLRTKYPNKKDKSDKELYIRAVELLNEVHLPDAEARLEHYPHQFSGGLLQRIMIAVALALDPELLIADEATTALDVTIQGEIIKLLLEIQEKRNLAILFISHDLALVSTISDRIAVMYSGLIVEQGHSSTVLHKPRHPYTRALLESVPRFGHNYQDGLMPTITGSTPNPLDPPTGCPFLSRCFLAKENGLDPCSNGIPPIIEENGIDFRCVYGEIK